jgi:hypothetical protein
VEASQEKEKKIDSKQGLIDESSTELISLFSSSFA